MEKVNYQPRCLRLQSGQDFIAPEVELPNRSVQFSFVGNDLVISEFDSYDPKDFSLDAQLHAGIVPSEINARFVNAKVLSLDHIDTLYNTLISLNDGQI